MVECRGAVASPDHVDAGHDGHGDDAPFVGDGKRHAEQAPEAVVDGGGVGDEEYEDDECGNDTQGLAVKALAKELGHGRRLDVVRHYARAAAEHEPGEQRADQRVADACPEGGETVLPAKLACVADEHDGGKVGGPVGERARPWAHLATAEHEAVDVRRLLAAVVADVDGGGDEYDEQCDFDDHRVCLSS